MRTARRVKQPMFYSTHHEGQPVYETDEEGNIVYDIMPDGERLPRQIGEDPEGYDTPVKFFNSITGSLTAEELQAFGVEARGKAKMTYRKGEFPFTVGVLIWKNKPIGYTEDGRVDEASADYRIIGIQETGRHFYKALLEAVV